MTGGWKWCSPQQSEHESFQWEVVVLGLAVFQCVQAGVCNRGKLVGNNTDNGCGLGTNLVLGGVTN